MQIFISLSDKTVTLDVEPSDKIEDVKLKLQDKEGICTHIQNLRFGSKNLESEKTIAYYNIQKESTLYCIFYDRSRNRFLIENENNIILVLRIVCPFCTTILSLKNSIKDKLGLKEEHQELSYGKIILKNSETLSNYGIEGESKIHLKII